METKLSKIIDEVVAEFPTAIWGACRLDYSLYANKYKYAVIFAVGYDYMMPLDGYVEKNFYRVHIDSYKPFNHLKKKLFEALDANNIDWFNSMLRSDFDDNCTSTFNKKECARRAGLGWIGKNDLLVTPQYGPRVNLFDIFVNDEVPLGTPIEKSYCGDCTRCVDNCLMHVLKGVDWAPGITRVEQVDYMACHKARNAARKTLHRKLACGKCMVSCPVGTDEWKKVHGDRLEMVGK